MICFKLLNDISLKFFEINKYFHYSFLPIRINEIINFFENEAVSNLKIRRLIWRKLIVPSIIKFVDRKEIETSNGIEN